MNNVTNISQTTQILTELLKSNLEQTAELAEKLIKLNVQNVIDINQLETMGNVIDTYR